MATVTGYMIVRGDYTTINLPLVAEVDATPGGEIAVTVDADGSVDYMLGPVITNLVNACNIVWQGHARGYSLVDHGLKLVELSFDNPDDVHYGRAPALTLAHVPFIDVGGFLVRRADVVAEVDAATIEANATVS